MTGPDRRLLGVLIRGELRTLMRDRVALVLMLLAPVLIYPLLFWGLGAMQDENERQTEERVVTVAAPEGFSDWVEPDDAVEVVAPDSPEAEDADATLTLPAELLSSDELRDAALDSQPAASLYGLEATITYRSDKRDSRTARSRVDAILDRQREADQAAYWKAVGINATPDDFVQVEWRDTATAQARSGHTLGRFLPMMLVFLALSGGLYAALDLIAGEKERGTLETLLTTRVDRRLLLRAKFAVVLLVTAVVSLLAVGALWASAASGAFMVPGSDEPLSLAPRTVGLAVVLLVPLVIQLAAILSAAGAYAPDFRAGQAMALPLMLMVVAPAAVTAVPGQELSWLLGAVPISGVALALRDALAGELDVALGLWTLLCACGHGAVALAAAERLMGREEVLLGGGSSKARHAKGRYHIEALALFALVMVLFLYFGQLAQSRDLVWGLVLSQVLLIAAPAVAAVWLLGRPVAATLRLRAPRPFDAGLALVAGACAPGVGTLVMRAQDLVVAVPTEELERFAAAFEVDLSLPVALLLFAVLPGVCEEVLFRGAILGLIERSLPRWATVAVVGLLFGLLHLAFYRILPTGALGLVLTWAALRSGSLWVAIGMHVLNNGLLVALSELGVLPEAGLPLPAAAWMAVACVGAVAAMGRGGASAPTTAAAA